MAATLLCVALVLLITECHGLPKRPGETTAVVSDLNKAHLCPLGLPVRICSKAPHRCPSATFCHSNSYGDFCCPQNPIKRSTRIRYQDASPWQQDLFDPVPGQSSPFESGQFQAAQSLGSGPGATGVRSQAPNYGSFGAPSGRGGIGGNPYAAYGPRPSMGSQFPTSGGSSFPYPQAGAQVQQPFSFGQGVVGAQTPFIGPQTGGQYGRGPYGQQPIYAQPIGGATRPNQPIYAQPIPSVPGYGSEPIPVFGQQGGQSGGSPFGFPQQPGRPGIQGGAQFPGPPRPQYGTPLGGGNPFGGGRPVSRPYSGYPQAQYGPQPSPYQGGAQTANRFNYYTAALQVARPQPFTGVFAKPVPRGGGSPPFGQPGRNPGIYQSMPGSPQYQRGGAAPSMPYPSALQQVNVERSRSPTDQRDQDSFLPEGESDLEEQGIIPEHMEPINIDSLAGESTVMDALLQQVRKLHAVSYSRSDCVRCRTAEALLEGAYSIPLTVFHLDKLPKGGDLLEFLGSITGSNEVPQIFVCGYYIGGYDHLLSYHESGELETFVSKCFAKKTQNIQ